MFNFGFVSLQSRRKFLDYEKTNFSINFWCRCIYE